MKQYLPMQQCTECWQRHAVFADLHLKKAQ